MTRAFSIRYSHSRRKSYLRTYILKWCRIYGGIAKPSLMSKNHLLNAMSSKITFFHRCHLFPRVILDHQLCDEEFLASRTYCVAGNMQAVRIYSHRRQDPFPIDSYRLLPTNKRSITAIQKFVSGQIPSQG